MPKIVIGVPTYNGALRANDLFHSISHRTPQDMDWRVVLVDDGSPNVAETREVGRVWEQTLHLKYAEHGTNRGISAGWNTASRMFDCEIVVLINDDVIVSTGWLQSLEYVLEHSPKVGVVGMSWHAFTPEDVPALIRSPRSDEDVIPRDPLSKAQDPSRRRFEEANPGRVMAPTGQLFAFRRKDYEAVGGFDEGFKSFYEETDFGTAMAAKLDKIGLQINYPHSWHRWSATFSSSPELDAGGRNRASHAHYCEKWGVPGGAGNTDPFGYTNPKYLGAVGLVKVKFLRKDGTVGKGILRPDGAYVDA